MPSPQVLTKLLTVWFAVFLAAASVFGQAGPPGATVSDFLAVDAQPGLVYAATSAGVFRSDDSGDTWAAMRDGLPRLPVVALSGSPAQLFAALDGGGVFRSRDGGVWELTSDGIGDLQVLSVANDPQRPNVLFAGTRADGVFFSDNSADGWIRAGTGLIAGAYLDLAIDPNNSDLVYAASAAGAFFESVDGGLIWQAAAAGPAAFRKIRFDPNDSNIVYCTTSQGMIRRLAAGQPFEQVAGAGALSYFDIEFDATDSMVLYAASEDLGMLISRDGGATYAQISNGLPLAFPFSLQALPGEPARVLMGAGGSGVYLTSDQGANWVASLTGLDGANVLSLAIDPQTPTTLYAGMDGGRMFKSLDGGDSWFDSGNGFRHTSPRVLEIDPTNPQVLYVGSTSPTNPNDGALSRSVDGGANWGAVQVGFGVQSLAVHPSDGRTVWVGTPGNRFLLTTGLFRSRDRADSFDAFLDDRFVLAGQSVAQIAIDPSNGRNIYVAAESFGSWLFLASDNEAEDFQQGGAAPAILALEVDPTDGRRVFIGSAGFGILLTEDRGENVVISNGGFPSDTFIAQAFAIDPSSGAVYAATSFGVARSDDHGRTWNSTNTGLDGRTVQRLVADPRSSGVVYASVVAGGVWKTVNAGASWEPTAARTQISSRGIVNAASFEGGGVAPGQIVSIFGVRIGPRDGVSPGFDPATGRLPTTFAGVTVFFNGVPAPLFFVRSDQINCQVPFEVAGAQVVEIRVEFDGQVSSRVELPVRESDPGLFGAVLNQDSSVNSNANRARPSQLVVLFANGQGLMNQPLLTGAPSPSVLPLPSPLLDVSVEVDGRPADIAFVGLTPGLVGLLQINIRLPPDLETGAVTVKLTIGERTIEAVGLVQIQR